ncbi:MAG: hypothetical protein PUP90_23725 [Nostoc sp. S4]|nr:hypothetical protein [Nostoc sp. S4]
MKLEEIINNQKVINLNQLKNDQELLKQIQTKLNLLGLYPGGLLIDGDYGQRTEAGLVEFCNFLNINNMNTGQFDGIFAQKLLNFPVLPFTLENAKNRGQVLSHFLAEGKAFKKNDKVAFLDRGINNSPYEAEIGQYAERLQVKPDGQNLVSLGNKTVLSNTGTTITFKSYPKIGIYPDSEIDEQSLNFLNDDITQACICIGSFVDEEIKVHWLGKHAQEKTQFWSATKIIPILNTVSLANQKFSHIEIEKTMIATHPFYDLVTDVISYQEKIGTSNAVAAMFKQFQTPKDLETWVKNITGNQDLIFRGKYHDPPLIEEPKLLKQITEEILLTGTSVDHNGENHVSAYDLTRFISLLGWHHHISQEARLPGAQWHSLKTVVKAMGTDKARYADAAIKRLGLQSVIKSPVIISKLGNGDSNTRNKTEIVYVAFMQFIDELQKSSNKPSKLRTLCMTLRGAKAIGKTVELDALMAAEVTEILRRVVTEELV